MELTIKDLTADDTKGTHKLTIKNEEGETNYDFKLALGKQPPPGNKIDIINDIPRIIASI